MLWMIIRTEQRILKPVFIIHWLWTMVDVSYDYIQKELADIWIAMKNKDLCDGGNMFPGQLQLWYIA